MELSPAIADVDTVKAEGRDGGREIDGEWRPGVQVITPEIGYRPAPFVPDGIVKTLPFPTIVAVPAPGKPIPNGRLVLLS